MKLLVLPFTCVPGPDTSVVHHVHKANVSDQNHTLNWVSLWNVLLGMSILSTTTDIDHRGQIWDILDWGRSLFLGVKDKTAHTSKRRGLGFPPHLGVGACF